MNKLVLLRHGESEANRAGVFSGRLGDPSLTRKGRSNITSQIDALQAQGITRVYSSPKQRALQTATPIAERLGLKVMRSEALLEVDVGSLDGRGLPDTGVWDTYDAVRQAWQQGDAARSMPEGESLNDIEARLTPLLHDLRALPGDVVLLVGHGMLFMTLLWLFCENRAATLQGNYMTAAHFSVLNRGKRSFVLEAFNVAPPEA